MGMQNSGWRSAGAPLEDLSNIWPFSGERGFRARWSSDANTVDGELSPSVTNKV